MMSILLWDESFFFPFRNLGAKVEVSPDAHGTLPYLTYLTLWYVSPSYLRYLTLRIIPAKSGELRV